MEPTAPIIVVDGGVGGLCQRQLSSMEAVVGWSRRRQSLSLTAALAVFVNDNRHPWRRRWDGLTMAFPCVDGSNPMFFGKPVFIDDGCHQWRRQWDGAVGSDHRH